MSIGAVPEAVSIDSGGVMIRGDRWVAAESRGQLLLLHGGGQTRHAWGGGARALCAAGWTCVSVDLRGHGDSDWAPDGSYDVPDHVEDMKAVCDQLGGEFVVVGASLGGITAIALADAAPEVVRGLVLVDIVPNPDPVGVKRILDFMTGRPEGFDSLEEVGDAVAAFTGRRRARNIEGLRKNVRLREDGRWHWHWDPALMTPHVREEPRPGIRADVILAGARALRVPVLLVRGGSSDVVSDAGVDELVAAVPGASVVVVPGAGHMVAGDDNDVFVAAVTGFLDERFPTAR